MRLPDKLTPIHFGRYHAGCYPANLGRLFAQRTVEFCLSLEARGFVHAPTIVPQKLSSYQIEVFPHPAIVHLFSLNRILKYRKESLVERR
jgi:predicted RNase H-like nuclease